MDYGGAKLKSVQFSNVQNDALDFSGSFFKANDIQISDVKDKGLSLGEQSAGVLLGFEIKNTTNAAVVKDGSILRMENGTIWDCQKGVLAYHKKKQYTRQNQIEVRKVELDEVQSIKEISRDTKVIWE